MRIDALILNGFSSSTYLTPTGVKARSTKPHIKLKRKKCGGLCCTFDIGNQKIKYPPEALLKTVVWI